MADRPPQYNMVPQGFNMLQQQQAQQQAQQQQQQLQQQQGQQQQPQPDSHPGPGFSALWQPQQQFRPRSGAGVGPNQPQMNDLMRTQNMNRVPSGQQMQFGMGGGMPNMGGQQPFHDPSSNQTANGNLPGGGFPSIGGMMNQGLNPAVAQQQRGNLLAGLPHQRQLDLMMAHSQNNPPMNFAKFPQQPQGPHRPDQPQHPQQQQPFLNPGMNHSSPADIFSPGMSNDALRRGSPSNPPNSMSNMPSSMPGHIPLNGQPRAPLTIAQIQERATAVRMAIQNEENIINNIKVQAQRDGNISEEAKRRVSALTSTVLQKKEYLAKIVAVMQQNQQPMGPQLTGGGNGPGPGWMGQGGTGTPFDHNIQRNTTPMQPNQPPQIPQGAPLPGAASAMAKPQTPISQQAGLPQRSDQQQMTPQRGPGAQHMGPPQGGNGGGPLPVGGMGGQAPFVQGMNGAGRATPLQGGVNGGMPSGGMVGFQPNPLDRNSFDRTIKTFYAQRNFSCDPSSLVVENRQVDLWSLHRIVMEMGGFCKIEAANAWDVVAGKMGFVHFPGSDGQPSRSGPATGLQICQYYKDYVQAFDAAYIRTMLESRVKISTGQPEISPQHKQHINQVVKSYSGFDFDGGNRVPPVNGNRVNLPGDSVQMQQLVTFAHRTVAELRQGGVPEHIINIVESRRSDLQRAYQDEVNFKGGVIRNIPGQQSQPMPNGNGGPGGVGGRSMQPPFGGAAGGLPGQMQSTQRSLAQGGMPNAPGNFMDARLQGQMQQMGGPPLPHHQQAGANQRVSVMNREGVPGMAGQVPGALPMVPAMPSKEQTQMALVNIAKHKREAQEAIQHLQPVDVPIEQRAQYNQLLEQVNRMSQDFDPKLPIIYSLIRSEDHLRKIIRTMCTVQYQRSIASQNSPRIIIGLDGLRASHQEFVRLNDAFSNAIRRTDQMRAAASAQSSQQQQQAQQHQQFLQQQHQHSQMQLSMIQQAQQQGLNTMSPPPNGHPLQDISRPPIPNQHPPSAIPHPQGQPQQTTPNMAAQQLRPVPMPLHPPPSRRQKQPGSAMTPGAMQSPSPAPAASTPPNAPTPNAMVSSPAQVPKSPKTKAPPKAKPAAATKRRPSKVAPSSAAAAAQTPQSQASPEASTSTPTQAHASIKRQREEDTAPSPGPANGPSPPKRAKMEDVQPSMSQAQQKAPVPPPTAPVKKEDMTNDIAHIKTGQDASQFLDQMTELIKYATTNANGSTSQQGPEVLSSDISETLEMLLKGCGPGETGADGNAFTGLGDLGAPHREGTPPPASLFDEFFDFSNVGEEEDSKVDTPELVSSSSTNPSPESNASEMSDPHNQHLQQLHQQPFSMSTSTSGGKTGFDDFSDAVRLGPWKEIDGGEAAYYQSNDWKWEGSMTTVDHPWAIFNQ